MSLARKRTPSVKVITLLLDSSKYYRYEEGGDFIYVDTRNTTADLTKVYFKTEDMAIYLPLSDYIGLHIVFEKLELKWEESEIGKTLVLIIGAEARFSLARVYAELLSDRIGLAKETTLQTLKDALRSEDKDAFNINLKTTEIALPVDLQYSIAYDSASDRLKTLPSDPPKLDLPMSSLYKHIRWGRDVTPAWIIGSEIVAPVINTILVSRTVSAGKRGYIYGFFISTEESNIFYIQWVSGGTTYRIRIPASRGLMYTVLPCAVNDDLPADSASTISIIVANAGSTVYQAGLLYAEV